MRWGVVPVIFALAGAAGGALDALLSGVVMGEYGNVVVDCAYIGGGIGLGIGSAMCLSRRTWVCLLPSPLLGIAGYFLLACIACMLGGHRLPELKDLTKDEFALFLAAPAAPILVAAHHLHLRLQKRGMSPFVSTALYAVLGAISGSVFWIKWGHLAGGLLNGVLYGLCQHVAMMAALGLEKWRAEPDSAQGLSPKQ